MGIRGARGAWRLPFRHQLDTSRWDSGDTSSISMIIVPTAETKSILRYSAASAGKVEIEGYASLPDSRVGFAGRDR